MIISVIIPTYNRAAVLERALQSVIHQSFTSYEVCVVDDGSTDSTKKLIEQKFPSVQYLYQDNGGVSAARNFGVANTTGEWIAFLDSDDEWLPEKLAEQVEAVSKGVTKGVKTDAKTTEAETNLIHTNEIWIRNGVRVNAMDKHEKRGGEIFSRCLPLCAISPSSVLLKRSLFEEVGGFDESLVACEDYDLWLKICSRYPVTYLDKPLLKKYGGHKDQLSRQHWGMDRFRIRALENFVRSENFTENITEAQRRETLNTLIRKCKIMSQGAAKRGNTERSQKYAKKVNLILNEFSQYLPANPE